MKGVIATVQPGTTREESRAKARRFSLKNIAFNGIALVIGTLIACGGLEVSARMLANVLGLTPYMEYDELLGWTATPNATKRHTEKRFNFDVTYQINSHGFRGRFHPQEKPQGIRRVMLLGDSNGFGWGIPEEQHLAALLGKRLSGVEVINLSLSGYGTDQEYLRFVRDGLRFEPDVVILQVTPNDFEEIEHSFFNQKPKPRYVLGPAGELRLTNVPVKPEGPKAQEFYDNSLPLPFKEWLGWHSYSYNFVNGTYHSARRRSVRTGDRADSSNRGQFSAESVRLFNRIVAELAGKLDEIGVIGLVVHASGELSQGRSRIESSLTVVDMYPKFMESKSRSVDPWFEDGYHWNVTGHSMVADGVVAALRERLVLD